MDLELRTWSVFYIPEELSDAMAKHSHYESEQLEVKWPQKSDETGADGTFQRTKRPAEDFDDDRKPLVTPVAVR